MCLNIGVPKLINISFVSNGKLIILGVPIFRHCTVVFNSQWSTYLPSVGVSQLINIEGMQEREINLPLFKIKILQVVFDSLENNF